MDDYGGYRRYAFEHRDVVQIAETQLAHIRDRRTRQLRYHDIEDLFAQARQVPATRLAAIAQGYNDTCAVHEAVALLTASPTIRDLDDHDISLNRWLVTHYLFGERRKGNMPKVDNLRELPRAVFAIRTRNPVLISNQREVRQYQYSLAAPKLRAYVYCNSGVVSGWHIVHRLGL